MDTEYKYRVWVNKTFKLKDERCIDLSFYIYGEGLVVAGMYVNNERFVMQFNKIIKDFNYKTRCEIYDKIYNDDKIFYHCSETNTFIIDGPVELYSGIKDIDNKLIYEGDIVTIKNDGSSWIMEYDSSTDRFYIETLTPTFFLRRDDTCYKEYNSWKRYIDDFEDDIINTIKVIGNKNLGELNE